VLDVVVVRPRFVARKPRRQRLGRLRPVDDREHDQREADEDGEPDKKTATLHDRAAYGLCPAVAETSECNAARLRHRLRCRLGGRCGFAAATVSTRHRSAAAGPIRNGDPRVAVSFAESISLSSTGSADLRLPPTAFASGFDLLALRARRKRESRRGQVLPQEVRKTKRAQFAEIQFSTFPQHTLQLVEIAPRVPNPPIKTARSKRLIEPGTCLESRICRTCLAPLRSTTA
jgi:hypothetical protein